MYMDLILLFILHLMLWYLSLIEGTITLLQISLYRVQAPSIIWQIFLLMESSKLAQVMNGTGSGSALAFS